MDRLRPLLLALLVATGLCGPAMGGEEPEAVGAGPSTSPTEPASLAREGERMGDAMVAGLSAGQLSNLHGLLRMVSLVWPMLAIVWFLRRTGRGGARSL